MTITRANPGGWVQNDPITPTQINAIDVNTTSAIDGVAGGTYNPTGQLVLGGNGLKLDGTLQLDLTARTVTRSMASLDGDTSIAANWSYTPTALAWENAGAAVAGEVVIPLVLPHGQTLTSVSVRIDPPNGRGAGNDVGTPPAFALEQVDIDNAITNLGNGADPTGGVIASGYESAHYVTLTGLTTTIECDKYRYLVRFTGESGANSTTGLILSAILVTVSCTSYPEC